MDKKIVLYVVIGVLILGLLVLTFFPNMIYAFADAGKSVENKCAVPAGQTEEEWNEHMSHHPEIYKDCL
ncbi:MAG: hypothetical protein Q8P57_00090 [Candidatus Pacearchaeota archaeon]|nr:hypothetical protein [Candidatus Pacearchaeota archaeon]